MKLGQSLQVLLKKRGWTLARLARESGVPSQTLHGWTTGRRSVDLNQVRKVAGTLEVSVHELAFGESDPHAQASGEILRELFTGDVRVTLHRIERRK
jgi:transcriptional regulator with XRE-family HTH domain